MLFLLTGEIQTGKTRWLEQIVKDLESGGAVCWGVLSPGIWKEEQHPDGSVAYQKLGIETEFLPGRQRQLFAQRKDLAEQNNARDASWQSSKAALKWAIPDAALEVVNRHFDALINCQKNKQNNQHPDFLIVDELGMLELKLNKGFTSAVKLLESGPASCAKQAIAIVRQDLVSLAKERFCRAWPEIALIYPNDQSRKLLLSL